MSLQPGPDMDTNVKPEGIISVTVTGALVGPAEDGFETITV